MRLNIRLLFRTLGMLLVIMAVSMLFPVAVSVYYGDGSQYGLMLAAFCILVVGLFLRNFIGAGASNEVHARDGVWFTVVIWIVVPLMGALPYLFTSSVQSFTDAAFESFSGFTTTGSSVLSGFDQMPQGLLVWRSTSQWIGGLGLILFVVAILRRLNVGAARLYESEFSGTLQRRLHPRLGRSVALMWVVYIALTVVLFVLLMAGGNGFVDSFCTATSTVSTGGFMTHDDGMASYSTYSMCCITLFMFMAGMNISVLYSIFTGKWREAGRDEEFRTYFMISIAATLVCFASIVISGGGLSVGTLGFSLFHVASAVSTCGFYTTGPSYWPAMVSVLTFLLVFVGASTGSTGGGLKMKRIMIVGRGVRNYFVSMVHPQSVTRVKVNGRAVDEEHVRVVFSFMFLYVVLITLGSFVLTFCGLDIPNALCMATANIGNLGPSPVANSIGARIDYISLAPVGKWTMVLLMLAGRLEIFTLVAVLLPQYWKRS